MSDAALVSIIGGVLGLIQLYINNKHSDKLKNLEFEQVQCKKESEQCKKNRDEDKIRLTVLEAELTATKLELKERDDRDKDDMQRQINELKNK